MTNDERNPNDECGIRSGCALAGFDIRASSFLRISSFVLRHSLVLGPWSLVIHSSFVLRYSPFIILFLLNGCAIGPNYKRPAIDPPGNFRNAPDTVSTESIANRPWWDVYKDDTLKGLIETALTNNYDLRIAVSRMEQARAIAMQTRSQFLPQIGYANALVSRQKLEAVRVQQSRAVAAYQEAVTVSTQRYIAGKASYYEVLEAQQQLLPAENSLAQTELNQLLAVVQLYKALGGGWTESINVESGGPTTNQIARDKPHSQRGKRRKLFMQEPWVGPVMGRIKSVQVVIIQSRS